MQNNNENRSNVITRSSVQAMFIVSVRDMIRVLHGK